MEYLRDYAYCFERVYSYSYDYRFINRQGQEKLRGEWPEIWEEFELDKYV